MHVELSRFIDLQCSFLLCCQSYNFQPTWESSFPWIKDSKLKGKSYAFCTSCNIDFKIGHRFLPLMGINYK